MYPRKPALATADPTAHDPGGNSLREGVLGSLSARHERYRPSISRPRHARVTKPIQRRCSRAQARAEKTEYNWLDAATAAVADSRRVVHAAGGGHFPLIEFYPPTDEVGEFSHRETTLDDIDSVVEACRAGRQRGDDPLSALGLRLTAPRRRDGSRLTTVFQVVLRSPGLPAGRVWPAGRLKPSG